MNSLHLQLHLLQSGVDDGIVVVNMETRTMAPAPMLTVEEYLRTPETLRPMELIYGVLRAAESPSIRHQQAVAAFHLALAPHVRAQRFGHVLLSPLDVIFDWERRLVLQPDLMVISHSRWRTRQDRLVCAPDIVLEVLSPNPRIGTLDERINWFAEYGVREAWLLHQTTTRFEILQLAEGRVSCRRVLDYSQPLRSDVLPEFRLSIDQILDGVASVVRGEDNYRG